MEKPQLKIRSSCSLKSILYLHVFNAALSIGIHIDLETTQMVDECRKWSLYAFIITILFTITKEEDIDFIEYSKTVFIFKQGTQEEFLNNGFTLLCCWWLFL